MIKEFLNNAQDVNLRDVLPAVATGLVAHFPCYGPSLLMGLGVGMGASWLTDLYDWRYPIGIGASVGVAMLQQQPVKNLFTKNKTSCCCCSDSCHCCGSVDAPKWQPNKLLMTVALSAAILFASDKMFEKPYKTVTINGIEYRVRCAPGCEMTE